MVCDIPYVTCTVKPSVCDISYVFSFISSEGFKLDSVFSEGRNRLKYHAQKVDINANNISTFENPQ